MQSETDRKFGEALARITTAYRKVLERYAEDGDGKADVEAYLGRIGVTRDGSRMRYDLGENEGYPIFVVLSEKGSTIYAGTNYHYPKLDMLEESMGGDGFIPKLEALADSIESRLQG